MQATEPSVAALKADLFKAMGHEVRIRVLEQLADGERSVSELADAIGVEVPHLSQQLRVLRRTGLVVNRKDGNLVFYAVKDPRLVEILAMARELLVAGLDETRNLLEVLKAEEHA